MKLAVLSVVMIMLLGLPGFSAFATEAEDPVAKVTAQLEEIDSLAEILANRSRYTCDDYYDTGTTDASIIAAHEAARTGYETYASEMYARRVAAQAAYDALTADQQAQIDASLVAKLDNSIDNVYNPKTLAVTSKDNEYTFEAVNGGAGYGYEISNHMVSGNIPQTFILVDTSDGKTSWTPNGLYEFGKSNYEVTYCCDIETVLEYNSHYKRLNLEDSNYYGEYAAKHIRAILQSSYPFVSMSEMKANLRAGGLNAAFVDSLTRSDMISAVQMAVWSYANANDGASGGLGYFASIDITKNNGIYFTALHDTNNECRDWLPKQRQRSYDARAEYRVNTLAYYLCKLDGVEAAEDEILISSVEVTRAELIPGSDGKYNVGMYVYLNNGGSSGDSITVTATSYNADGVKTGSTRRKITGDSVYELNVSARYGDTIKVVVDGMQHVEKGVYFYEPEGGRDASQCLVGVGEGNTAVHAEKEFVFEEDVEMGLRIYKTAVDTGLPISDITFDVYSAVPAEGEQLSEKPTEAEIAKYAVEANKVGAIVTDETGYGALSLEKGVYLVVEKHNADKVKAPVDPFYVMIPMAMEESSADGGVTIVVKDIVSIYPKNEPVIPPEEPPVIPPPPTAVKGKFGIVKHDAADASIKLEGAAFKVYRAATDDDANVEIIVCNGVEYAVVPVISGGEQLVLTTGKDGTATSPELACGVYFLVETKAPDGYNKLEEAVSVTVVSSELENYEIAYIGNEAGSILPETGGMGTTAMLTAGSIMVLAAGVILIARKRSAG